MHTLEPHLFTPSKHLRSRLIRLQSTPRVLEQRVQLPNAKVQRLKCKRGSSAQATRHSLSRQLIQQAEQVASRRRIGQFAILNDAKWCRQRVEVVGAHVAAKELRVLEVLREDLVGDIVVVVGRWATEPVRGDALGNVSVAAGCGGIWLGAEERFLMPCQYCDTLTLAFEDLCVTYHSSEIWNAFISE